GSVFAQSVLFHNFNGYTLTGNPGHEAVLIKFDAMLIRDGKVAAIGTLAELESVYGSLTKQNRVNLNGKFVLPGLIDAHGHVLGLGQNLMLADLRDAKSQSDAASMVANFAKSVPSAEWI